MFTMMNAFFVKRKTYVRFFRIFPFDESTFAHLDQYEMCLFKVKNDGKLEISENNEICQSDEIDRIVWVNIYVKKKRIKR